jgi:hypothetical protein
MIWRKCIPRAIQPNQLTKDAVEALPSDTNPVDRANILWSETQPAQPDGHAVRMQGCCK